MSWRLRWPWRRKQEDCPTVGLRLALLQLLARLFDCVMIGLALMLASMRIGHRGLAWFWFLVKLVLLATSWPALWTWLLGATPG